MSPTVRVPLSAAVTVMLVTAMSGAAMMVEPVVEGGSTTMMPEHEAEPAELVTLRLTVTVWLVLSVFVNVPVVAVPEEEGVKLESSGPELSLTPEGSV